MIHEIGISPMKTCLELIVVPLPVPDNAHEEEAKYHVMNIGEDVVEIGHLEGLPVEWRRAEKVVVAEVLVSGAQKLMILAVYFKANSNLGCEFVE